MTRPESGRLPSFGINVGGGVRDEPGDRKLAEKTKIRGGDGSEGSIWSFDETGGGAPGRGTWARGGARAGEGGRGRARRGGAGRGRGGTIGPRGVGLEKHR